MKRKTPSQLFRRQTTAVPQGPTEATQVRSESVHIDHSATHVHQRAQQPQPDLKQQIQRLQQRQLAYLEETNRELESLQQQVAEAGIVEEMRLRLSQLERENQLLSQQITKRDQAVKLAANNLGELARILAESEVSYLPQAQKFSQPVPGLDEETPLKPTAADWQEMVETPSFSTVQNQASSLTEELSAPIVHTAIIEAQVPQPLVEDIIPPKKRKKFKIKKLIFRTLVLALFVLGGNKAYKAFTSQSGQVAGAETQTSSSPEPSFDPYAEAYTDLPFSATEWATHTDSDFGITLDYPKNTTSKVRTTGGNNLWFLRHNGYLLKISFFSTQAELETWWQDNQSQFLDPDTDKLSRGSFKNLNAIIVESSKKTITSGTSYFVKRSNGIYQFWVKDEPASTDDGQRVQRMVESLKFGEPLASSK